jgi:hypothetical protein
MSCFVDAPFVLSLGDGQAGESVQPVTLYLSINVPVDSPPEYTEPIRIHRYHQRYSLFHLRWMSAAENTLHDADEATKAIDLTNTWEGAVARIQWLMDTLSPVAGVRHSAMSLLPHA